MIRFNRPGDIEHSEDGPAAKGSEAERAASKAETQHHSIGLAEGAGMYERLLLEILATMGWRGEHSRLFEALPYLQEITSLTMLRTVLDRLYVSSIKVHRRGRQLTASDLPYLVVDGGNCWLVRSVDGKIQVYNADPATASVDAGSLRGTVYLLRMNKPEDAAVWTPVDGFVRSIFCALRKQILAIAAYSAAITTIGIGLSLYILLVYDLVVATGSRDTLLFLAFGAAAGVALEFYLLARRSKRIAYVAARVEGVVQVRALAAVIGLPLTLTERAPRISQLARFRQFELARELFTGRLASSLLDLPFTLLFLAMLFVIGGSLAFVPLGIILVMIAFAVLSVPASLAHSSKIADCRLKAERSLFELATRIGALRGASAESRWLARYCRKLAAYERARFESVSQGTTLLIALNALMALAGIATLGVGAQRVIDDTLSLGGLVACMIIVWRMLMPVQIVLLNLPRLLQLRATIRQINDLMRMRPEREEPAPLIYRRLSGSISTSGLYLNVGSRQEPQLRGVNIDIQPGEIVAITGPSGSGKMPLLKVLLGLYPQYVGTVRLGGLDMRQLDPVEIRAAIGYASDNLTFFYGTIAANLRFAYADAHDQDLIEALAAVGIQLPHPDLPEGLQTRISGNAAQSFSQNMLCRLSLARAFVKKSPIILLDEAHSDLDPGGEAAVLSHLNSLRGQTTVVLVTACTSHMRIADRIIVMNAGTVVDSGAPGIIMPRILEGIRDGAA